MKTLKFAANLVPLVLSGEKTSTWRLFDEKDLQVGDEINEGHEKFRSDDERLHVYREYYGDAVTDDTMVKMLKYELV